MASLNPRKSNTYYSTKDHAFHQHNGDMRYSSDVAVETVINYVTRTGARADRIDDLIGYGCSGTSSFLTPDDYILLFRLVQQHVRGDRRLPRYIAHEILTFSDSEANYLLSHQNELMLFAKRCAEETYYQSGFLCVYGIHYGIHSDENDYSRRLHIHFVINAVNHITGNLFYARTGRRCFSPNDGKSFYHIPYETKEREAYMNKILYEMMQIENPYAVDDPAQYFSNAYNLYPRSKASGHAK